MANTRSLTHWSRPGIEPSSSWIPVEFFSAAPQWELLGCVLIKLSLQKHVRSWIEPGGSYFVDPCSRPSQEKKNTHSLLHLEWRFNLQGVCRHLMPYGNFPMNSRLEPLVFFFFPTNKYTLFVPLRVELEIQTLTSFFKFYFFNFFLSFCLF